MQPGPLFRDGLIRELPVQPSFGVPGVAILSCVLRMSTMSFAEMATTGVIILAQFFVRLRGDVARDDKYANRRCRTRDISVDSPRTPTPPRAAKTKVLQTGSWTPPSHGGSTGSNPVCAS
jgi:hypothetical protein